MNDECIDIFYQPIKKKMPLRHTVDINKLMTDYISNIKVMDKKYMKLYKQKQCLEQKIVTLYDNIINNYISISIHQHINFPDIIDVYYFCDNIIYINGKKIITILSDYCIEYDKHIYIDIDDTQDDIEDTTNDSNNIDVEKYIDYIKYVTIQWINNGCYITFNIDINGIII